MLPPVDRQDDDLLTYDAKIDRVRKTRQHGSPCLTVRSLVGQGIRLNARHELGDGDAELHPEPLAAGFVPPAHFKRVIFGLRPENNSPRHA
jgi:hypothetical protein